MWCGAVLALVVTVCESRHSPCWSRGVLVLQSPIVEVSRHQHMIQALVGPLGGGGVQHGEEGSGGGGGWGRGDSGLEEEGDGEGCWKPLEAVDFELFLLGQANVCEERADIFALVSLQLDHFTILWVFNHCPVTGKLLLEGLD